MGRPEDSPLTSSYLPSTSQLSLFSRTKRDVDGPQISGLKVDLGPGTSELKGSFWNQQAVLIISNRFYSNNPSQVSRAEFRRVVWTHLRTLRLQFVRAEIHASPAAVQDDLDKKAKNAANRRCRTVSLFFQRRCENLQRQTLDSRVNAASTFAKLDPHLANLLPILKKMKASAMSEDEAETTMQDGKDRTIYIVRDLEWRNIDLKNVLVTLDHLHLASRHKSDGNAGRGTFPRHRIRDTARPSVQGHPPRSMPRNFYATDWLTSLSEWDYEHLDVQEPVSLSLSPDVLRQVASFPWDFFF